MSNTMSPTKGREGAVFEEEEISRKATPLKREAGGAASVVVGSPSFDMENKTLSEDGADPDVDEQAVDDLQGDYPAWAQTDNDGLREAINCARSDPKTLPQAISDIYKCALDLKGQGGGFEYDLITSTGDLLTKFMEERETVSSHDFEIIYAHVDAMQAVIRQDIKGDGGKVGNQIVDGLSELVLKKD